MNKIIKNAMLAFAVSTFFQLTAVSPGFDQSVFSPNGSFLVISKNGGKTLVLNASSLCTLCEHEISNKNYASICFSPNGSLYAICNDGGDVRIYNSDNELYSSFKINEQNLFCCCFLNDKEIALGCYDSQIYIYNVESGFCVETLVFGCRDGVEHISVSRDGRFIVGATFKDDDCDGEMCDDDGCAHGVAIVKVFNVLTKNCIKNFIFREEVVNVLFSPDNVYLVVITKSNIHLYNMKDNLPDDPIKTEGFNICSAAFSPMNSRGNYSLSMGCDDGLVRTCLFPSFSFYDVRIPGVSIADSKFTSVCFCPVTGTRGEEMFKLFAGTNNDQFGVCYLDFPPGF